MSKFKKEIYLVLCLCVVSIFHIGKVNADDSNCTVYTNYYAFIDIQSKQEYLGVGE